MTESIDPELQPIAAAVAGMDKFQIQAVRQRIMAEIRALEPTFTPLTAMDDPNVFRRQRDRLTSERRQREVAYLNSLLDAPVTRA
jgi:hypothetical protein